MKLIYDAFTEPEPHYAQIIKADKLKPIEVYPKEENTAPARRSGTSRTPASTRNGNNVTVSWSRSARTLHADASSKSTKATT